MAQKRFYKAEELSGKPVVNQIGMIVGKAKEMAISSEGRMGIAIESKQGGAVKESIIFFDEISAIGDVVLLRPSKEAEMAEERIGVAIPPGTPAPPPEKMKVCSRCGQGNRPTAKFCVKCGSKIP